MEADEVSWDAAVGLDELLLVDVFAVAEVDGCGLFAPGDEVGFADFSGSAVGAGEAFGASDDDEGDGLEDAVGCEDDSVEVDADAVLVAASTAAGDSVPNAVSGVTTSAITVDTAIAEWTIRPVADVR